MLQVAELRQQVAKQLQLPADRLRLVHKGTTLWDGRDAPTFTDAGADCQGKASGADYVGRAFRAVEQPPPHAVSQSCCNASVQMQCLPSCRPPSRQPVQAAGMGHQQRQTKILRSASGAELLLVKVGSLTSALACRYSISWVDVAAPVSVSFHDPSPLMVTGSGRVPRGWRVQRRKRCAAAVCLIC
jgi:hypothetical protein